MRGRSQLFVYAYSWNLLRHDDSPGNPSVALACVECERSALQLSGRLVSSEHQAVKNMRYDRQYGWFTTRLTYIADDACNEIPNVGFAAVPHTIMIENLEDGAENAGRAASAKGGVGSGADVAAEEPHCSEVGRCDENDAGTDWQLWQRSRAAGVDSA